MPELPEVETVRDGLERHIVGRTIVSARVFRDYSVRRHLGGVADFEDILAGQTIGYVARRGKFLWIGLEGTELALAGHLGMSGQLLLKAYSSASAGQSEEPVRASHCRVRLYLADAGEEKPDVVLDFVDQRTFGYLCVENLVPTPDGLAGGLGTNFASIPANAAHIARDLLDPVMGSESPQWTALVRAIKARSVAIKKILLDQTVVSGIGNIYADEALWRASVHGERPASQLTKPQISRLLAHAQDVMREALKQGGTSFDALYVNVNGESGYFDRSLNAYGREHEPCYRCGTLMRRSSFMNRSSYWCPKCQTKPRELTR